MGARDDLLGAALSLEEQGRSPFTPAELISEARSAGSTYPDTTLRTFIVGPMCRNSPNHHAAQYGDLERVARSQYRLVSPRARPSGARDANRSNAPAPRGRSNPRHRPSRSAEELAQSVNVEGNIKTYLRSRGPNARYSSFDYCFNYFRSHQESGRVEALLEREQLRTSCLQLGFFLASWGMFRGRAKVASHSVKCFEPVIESIVAAPAQVWEIDAHAYTEDAIDVLLEVRRELQRTLPGGASPVLVTKTMLGVFGCVPAFDRYFSAGLGVGFGRGSLDLIGRFYEAHAGLIERYRVSTLDFSTGEATDRIYTRAKVIDMVFFIQGIGAPYAGPPASRSFAIDP